MLRVAIIALAATVLGLFLLNTASLPFAPSCIVEQVVPSSGGQEKNNQPTQEFCAAPKGIIIAGVKQIAEVLPTDAWTALATVIMSIFTGVLSIVAYQQIGLARNEFLATNRPVLRVRYFRQGAGTHDQIQIRFAVVNAGKSRADLLGSKVVVIFSDPDKLGPPVYITGEDVVTPRKFEVGASDEYIALGAEKGAAIQNNENYGKYLFVYGYLVYSDDVGNTRTTAFGRRYLRARKRFIKIEDDDYEYED